MKDIIFNQPKINTKVSSKEIFVHYFEGINFSSKTIKVEKMGASCPCLTFDKIEKIEPDQSFKIKTYVNKLNQSGFFSVALHLEFSNGQHESLTISGEIK